MNDLQGKVLRFWEVMNLLTYLFCFACAIVSVLASTNCPAGFVALNNLCVQQATTCPTNFILLNGLCHPFNAGSCPFGYLYINGQCCTLSCIASCQAQPETCNCCGLTAQTIISPSITPNPLPTQPEDPCSNQPVTPYPLQTPSPCDNQPVTPYPQQPVVPCPNQPVTPYPQQTVSPCPNQPIEPVTTSPVKVVTPCPVQPVEPCPPCPNEPNASTPDPSEHTKITSSTTTPSPTTTTSQTTVTTPPTGSTLTTTTTATPSTEISSTTTNPSTTTDSSLTPSPAVSTSPPMTSTTSTTTTSSTTTTPPETTTVLPSLSSTSTSTATPAPTSTPTPTTTRNPTTTSPTTTPFSTTASTTTTLPTTTTPPSTTTSSTSSTTPSPSTTTSTPPPGEIIKCPDGTVLVNHVCRLLYCGKGQILSNNRCIQTICPEGTIWTGIQCARRKPDEYWINFNNTIKTQINDTESEIVINNVNTMIVNATIEVQSQQCALAQACGETENEIEIDTEPETESSNPPLTPDKCCTVITPRMCRRSNSQSGKWNCYNRRYKRCGDFCIAPMIYLKAPQVRESQNFIVIPPNSEFAGCRNTRTCQESDDFYDCSGCASRRAASCSSYCYSYNPCTTLGGCRYYDQFDYCRHNHGGEGCRPMDGCLEDWCVDDGTNY